MDKRCEVCDIMNEEAYVETTHWHVILSYKQAYLGRSLAALKRHCGDLAELTADEWVDLQLAIRQTEDILRKAFDATVFNWGCLMNNAFQQKPYNPHVHCHVWPRYDHPVTIEGKTYTDDLFGNHYDDPADNPKAPPEELAGIMKRIREVQ